MGISFVDVLDWNCLLGDARRGLSEIENCSLRSWCWFLGDATRWLSGMINIDWICLRGDACTGLSLLCIVSTLECNCLLRDAGGGSFESFDEFSCLDFSSWTIGSFGDWKSWSSCALLDSFFVFPSSTKLGSCDLGELARLESCFDRSSFRTFSRDGKCLDLSCGRPTSFCPCLVLEACFDFNSCRTLAIWGCIDDSLILLSFGGAECNGALLEGSSLERSSLFLSASFFFSSFALLVKKRMFWALKKESRLGTIE